MTLAKVQLFTSHLMANRQYMTNLFLILYVFIKKNVFFLKKDILEIDD